MAVPDVRCVRHDLRLGATLLRALFCLQLAVLCLVCNSQWIGDTLPCLTCGVFGMICVSVQRWRAC